jgi:hypothetical protein
MHHYLESALCHMNQATVGLDDAALARRPWEGKWSPMEHVEHLSLSFKGTARLFRSITAAGRVEVPTPTPQQWLNVLLVVELGLFPSGRKAPEFVEPQGLGASAALAAFREHIREMDEAINDAECQFGTYCSVAKHPILGPLTVNQWRRFHFVHTRHHMRLIEDLSNAAGGVEGIGA